MIAIVDYGVGNLFSLKSSFAAIGEDAFVTSSAQEIRDADKILLPGVGAFEDAAKKLRQSGLADVVCQEVENGKLLLGIFLIWGGMLCISAEKSTRCLSGSRKRTACILYIPIMQRAVRTV